MTDVVLAVVGSTQFEDDPRAARAAADLIRAALRMWDPGLVVSGGAAGIDRLAVSIAKAEGYETREFPARVRRWKGPGGFEERNLWIAEACTHLLAIRHHASRTFGSGWTANQAQRLGKQVGRILVT